MPALKSAALRLFSASYTLVFVALALLALQLTHYDLNKLFLYFLLPFYLLSLALQYLLPKVNRPLEKNELLTDMVSNASVMLINTVQAAIVAWAFHHVSSSLLVSAGWVGPQWSLASLPFALQVLAGLLLFDFMFYVTHRLCHEWPLLWRFHSVHHSAHRVTFLNAYRAHPVDVVVRRFIPLAGLLMAGPSHEAYVAAVTIGSVLATVTHLNIDLRHGWLNYLIGTNEVHRWHHSSVYTEARNFGGFTIWDQMFGTFFLPRDRDIPERIGLGNEDGYPVHNYWKQLWQPFAPRGRGEGSEERPDAGLDEAEKKPA